jgi:exopolysaccharide biosynthesis polyprenyl glycosylphosphotransferase
VQERKWLLGTVDTGLAVVWLLGGYYAWRAWAHPTSPSFLHVSWDWVIGGATVWLLVSWMAGAYELETADRFLDAARVTITVSIIVAVASLLAYYGFLKTYPRPALGLAIVGMPVSVLAWRAVYASLLRRPAYATRLLVVGNAALCSALTQVAQGREGSYRVLGFVSDRPAGGAQYLGATADLAGLADRYEAHRIVVAPRQSLSNRLVAVLSGCIERGLEVVDFSAAYEEIAGKVAVEHAYDFWLAALPTRPNTSSLEEAAMRIVDIVGAVAGLALTFILAPFIVAAIVMESGTHVIYRQERLGRAGRPFTVYKFRSMRRDAEAKGAQWAVAGDLRTTRVGRFLRCSHLDELPQFWNVLRGEMSLVGPRPERPEFTEALARSIPFYRLRLAVRPGLSGLKQIRVGYAATPEEHLDVLRHDLYYIKHRSLALNLVIMARTLGSVLGMKGR